MTVKKQKDKRAIWILCGGRSSRMGQEKCLLPFGKGSLLEYQIEKLSVLSIPLQVVLHHGQDYKNCHLSHCQVYYDLHAERSSLGGLYSALSQSSFEHNIVIGGDMPFIPPPLINYLFEQADGHEIVVPLTSDGYQPLCSYYHKNCVSHIQKQLQRKENTIFLFYPALSTKIINEKTLHSFGNPKSVFFNINTPTDYKKAVLMLENQHCPEE